MDVIYQSRSEIDPDVAAELGARRVELDELLAVSDVVSLHCPYGPATHHLIGAEQFTAMKSSAYLVNTARGPIVDEAALAAALRDGAIAGAGLDVFEREPEVHPELLELGNVALVPHLGSATIKTRTAMATLAADNALAVLRGEQPPTPIGELRPVHTNGVNNEALATWSASTSVLIPVRGIPRVWHATVGRVANAFSTS